MVAKAVGYTIVQFAGNKRPDIDLENLQVTDDLAFYFRSQFLIWVVYGSTIYIYIYICMYLYMLMLM